MSKSTTTKAKALDPRPYIPSPWEAFYEFSRFIWLGYVATFGAWPRHKSQVLVGPGEGVARLQSLGEPILRGVRPRPVGEILIGDRGQIGRPIGASLLVSE